MEIAVFTFVFVFVALVVGGNRALNLIAAHKAKAEAERRLRAISRSRRTEYTGEIYSRHGRIGE